MAIVVTEHSRILIQGITGSTGRSFAERMLRHGTPVVGGVTPGRGGQEVHGLPVFDFVADAVAATGADTALLSVPPLAVRDAVVEAVDAGIRTIVIYSEGVPVHDAIRMVAYARGHEVQLFGPNSAGVISPGQANISDLNDVNVPVGRIGIVSKSGTLTYEAIGGLAEHGMGASTVCCLGGDPITGMRFADVLPLFEQDPQTDAVVLLGEIGGDAEHQAAEVIRQMKTPVFAFVAGRSAPTGKTMGHAGALISGERDGALTKQAALAAAGATVVPLITEVGDYVIHSLQNLTRGR
jgi:succinyl-CoA synthetase alpha subunit